MINSNLKNFLDCRVHEVMRHYEKAKQKYEAIWDYYANNMQICIPICNEKANQYSDRPSREGPQGIYWIGETPKIFIVGREHFGWYGSSDWQTNRDDICYSPIEFAFFTVPSMGSYWGIVKDLLCDVLSIDISSWDSILTNSAFSNSCKCLSNKTSYNWILHQSCFEIGYCRKEIEIVQAPVNILFTKSLNLAKRMFSENSTVIESTSEFLVLKANNQIIIECAHPGRQSNDWRQRLKEIAKATLRRDIELPTHNK